MEAILSTDLREYLRARFTQLESELAKLTESQREQLNELEIRLGKFITQPSKPKLGQKSATEVRSKFISGQSLLQFKQIIEQLQRDKIDYQLEPTEYSLDIIPVGGDQRVTIYQQPNIIGYCLDQSLDKLGPNQLQVMIKSKYPPIDGLEYDFRIQYASEQIIKLEQASSVLQKINQPIPKMYRYKKRYSFVPVTGSTTKLSIRYDLTVIKEAKGITFNDSQVLKKDEKYEVELELVGFDFQVSESNALINSLYDHLDRVIRWSQDAFALTSRLQQENIKQQYLTLVYDSSELARINKLPRHKRPTGRRLFIGMDVLPLKIGHLIKTGKADFYPIERGYSVTEKADGERNLLMISDDGSIYLIDNRLHFKNTGLICQTPELFSSIFDGELVAPTPVSWKYLLFDCLVFNGTDLRSKPLKDEELSLNEEDRLLEVKTRHQAMVRFKQLLITQSTVRNLNLTIELKDYLFYDPKQPDQSILQLAKNTYHPEKYDYQLDGLVFTPYLTEYPKAQIFAQPPVRWDELLKWKPIEQLSIDFLIEFVAKVTGSDHQEYQLTNLKVSTTKMFKTRTGKSYSKKVFINFMPKKGASDQASFYQTRLLIDSRDGNVRAQDGNILFNGAVVEFAYQKNKPAGYRWIPLRFRADKTENKAPNRYQTANDNWNQIEKEVTKAMMFGEASALTEITRYYAQDMEQLGRLIQPLKTYHNQIKSWLLSKVTKLIRAQKPTQKFSLLDLATGRAGDLHKWRKNKIDYVLGIEESRGNLDDPTDGAHERLSKLQERYTYPSQVEFIWGDVTKTLNNGSAGLNQDYQNYIRNIYARRGSNSFDLVSCQFAIHYFTDQLTRLRTFLANVSTNLKIGGYFIGTSFDGRALFAQLREAEQGRLTGFKQDKVLQRVKIWELTKQWNAGDALAQYGQKINSYNIAIGQDFPEYLVNYEYLISLAQEYQLELVEKKSFKELQGQFPKLVAEMSEDEKRLSNFNVYFIFKKINFLPIGLQASEAPAPVPVPETKPVPVSATQKIKPKLFPKPTSSKPTPVQRKIKPKLRLLPKT